MTYTEFSSLLTDYTDKLLAATVAHKGGKGPEYQAALEAASNARGALWDAVRESTTQPLSGDV